jgi:hypothetical protein
MDISDAIDRRLPYRVGYPTLPTLPVVTEYAPCTKYFTNVGEWSKDLPVMLDNLGIDTALVDTRYRYHKGCKKDDEVTLVVLASYDEDCQPKWIQAIKDIHAYFHDRNIPMGIIELVDMRVWYRPPEPKPILSQEKETLRAIAETQPQLAREITAYSWVTVDVLHWYSPARGDHHPTFVITARDTSNLAWWTTTIPAIRTIIADAHAELDVVLLHLNNLSIHSHATDNATNDEYQPPDPAMLECFYDDPVPMGSSCGLRGSRDSGTWGCRVLLEKDGNKLDLGLTNCHVLLRDFARDNQGSFPPGSFEENFTVMSPSDRDHEVAKGGMEERITKATAKLRAFNNRHGELGDEEMLGTTTLLGKYLTSEFNAATEHLAVANIPEIREMGTIFAASGYITAPLDIEPSITIEDAPKDESKGQSKDESKDAWALDWCLFRLDRQAILREKTGKPMTWAHVDPLRNYDVTKQGRSTDVTKGIVSATTPLIHRMLPEPDLGKSTIVRDKIKNIFGGRTTCAHAVISTSVTNGGHFSLPGDSGSVVVHESNNSTRTALGLIYAANDTSMVTYMIPMEVLVKSINDVTGGKVIKLLEW